MTLLREYAVEPACFGIDFRTAAQVLNLFGCDRGRVIAGCPRAWADEARRALERWPVDQRHTAKRKKVIERLVRLASSGLFPERPTWRTERPWAEAALEEHRVRPFQAVLATEPRDADSWITVPNDLDPGEPCFEAGHEIRVDRTSGAMAEVLAPLLRASKIVLFVDPYFSPREERFIATLRALVGRLNGPVRLEYHTLGYRRFGRQPLNDEQFRLALERSCNFVPPGLTLSFLRWREREGGERFHARYIITNRATVRVDNGLDEGRPGETVPLTILPHREHERISRTYSESSNVFELLLPIHEVSALGVVQDR